MSLRQHSQTIITVCAVATLVSLGASGLLAVPTSDDVMGAKAQFDHAWRDAAALQQRRVDLEVSLERYRKKADETRAQLAQAAQERHGVRLDIAQHKRLIDALGDQIRAAQDLRHYYAQVSAEQRDELQSFVRVIALRRMEIDDTGPVVGDTLTRRLLRGSLGESIARDLNRTALLLARKRLLLTLKDQGDEMTDAVRDLTSYLGSMNKELDELLRSYETLAGVVDERTAALDQSWKAQQLTTEQLQFVREETEDANMRVGQMQRSLRRIHQELKDSRQSDLTRKIANTRSELDALKLTKKKLLLEQEALEEAKDAELRALNAGMQMRNTDPKQHKFVERAGLDLTIKQRDRDVLLKQEEKDEQRLAILADQIAILTEKLEILKKGVPERQAEDYAQSRREAKLAQARQSALEDQIVSASAAIAKAEKALSDAVAELAAHDAFPDEFALLPASLFSWPVYGPISAGYMDPDYEHVFHVPHRAIDIVTKQGTSVHPISDGIVYAYRDGGAKGYTYVLIGHRNGYASLYGHLSTVFVKPGDIVTYSTVIGLSGGIPGTPGAGHMTTGAHLHLEVMINGKHVNPRTVLPKG